MGASKYSDDNIGNLDLPENIAPNINWTNISYKGKDLLEATNCAGGPNRKTGEGKACLEFRDLMAELEEQYISAPIYPAGGVAFSTHYVAKRIYAFAYFIYADEKRAEYFTDQMLSYFK